MGEDVVECVQHAGAAFDLPVQPLQRIGRLDLLPVLVGKVRERGQIPLEAVMLCAARIDALGELGHGAGVRRVRVVAFAEAEQMALTGQITDAVTITSWFRARQTGLGEEGPAA